MCSPKEDLHSSRQRYMCVVGRLTPGDYLPLHVVSWTPIREPDFGVFAHPATVLIHLEGIEVEGDIGQQVYAPKVVPHVTAFRPQYELVQVAWVVWLKLQLVHSINQKKYKYLQKISTPLHIKV